MVSHPRILYAGALFRGSTALQRMRALEDVGAIVTPVDTCSDAVLKQEEALFQKVRKKLIGPVDLANANVAIRDAVRREPFDILWIDKGLTIEPQTMREVRAARPECKIVGYSPDDMMNPGNQTRRFLGCLPLYDVYFTTKSYGVAELKSLGARRGIFVGNAYDPAVHRPIALTPQERKALGGPVGFVGQWEADRAEQLSFLAESGVPVRVWGPSWEKCRRRPPGLRVEGKSLWADDYVKAVCAFDINLCFLRKANRDLQTTRSIEIPACGVFMLGERTDEHLALFKEGVEAEFFATREELLEKVRYYLANPEARQRIATAGRERCLRSGYSNQDRMRFMLKEAMSP